MNNLRQEFHFDTRYAVLVEPPQKNCRLFEVGPMPEIVAPQRLTFPLQRAEYERYLGQQVPVTFVLDVPLKELVGGEPHAFIEEVAFAEPVRLSDLQYRPVGASYDELDGKYNGRVHLQIVCAIDLK
jgi:hypothetical protein